MRTADFREVLLLSLGAVSVAACASDGEVPSDGVGASMVSGNSGAETTGGTTTGVGAGGTGGMVGTGGVGTSTATTGGAAAGGQATGGATAGGATSGDTTTGGQATGGMTAGGGTTGGNTSGGMGAGGTTGGEPTGGTATGGTGGGAGYPLGNAPVPSTGCGHTASLSSGTHHMTSAGLDRQYILELPDNYDSNKPYRLIFGMHWLGGSASDVQNWSKWWGLDALDTEDSVIWVAPQGYTDGSPWRDGDDKDHVYFDDLYEALTSDLCIDKSRVFSIGFSFGAMFTNGLAQTHQDVLRGVIVYETADYHIYFPENTGEPLAYMGVHGIDDPTCPISAGRSSRDRFVSNNGCTVPSSVPEAKHGGSQIIYDYECPSNYPVRWVTFDGKHTYPPNDDEGTWVYGVTWEFITQF